MNSESSERPVGKAVSPVTLHLPPDIAAALDRLSLQSGKRPTQLLLDALRRGLNIGLSTSVSLEAFQQLADRVAALEQLSGRGEVVQEKSIALPPERPLPPRPPAHLPKVTSVAVDPLPLATPNLETSALEHCPKCEHSLNPPLKTSGRQVCVKCGWTNKPRPASSQQTAEVTSDTLKQLLDQAATDALTNMQPRSKQNPSNPGGKGLFPFGK